MSDNLVSFDLICQPCFYLTVNNLRHRGCVLFDSSKEPHKHLTSFTGFECRTCIEDVNMLFMSADLLCFSSRCSLSNTGCRDMNFPLKFCVWLHCWSMDQEAAGCSERAL